MLKAKFPDELKSIKGTMLGDDIREMQGKLEGEGTDFRPDMNRKIGMGNMVMINLVTVGFNCCCLHWDLAFPRKRGEDRQDNTACHRRCGNR